MSTALLEARRVTRRYRASRRWLPGGRPAITAVHSVSLALERGEILGLVGESGSGKTTLGRILSGLEAATDGRVLWDGKPAPSGSLYWRRVQFVYADPLSSLNPRHRLESAVALPLARLTGLDGPARDRRVAELLELVELAPDLARRFPHQLSGGQLQRLALARALAASPQVLVLDEPISGLDVSLQVQILSLLSGLRRSLGLTYLFIAHDLAVVESFCDRAAVMKDGRLVEQGPPTALFRDPHHPYTRKLVAAVPRLPAHRDPVA